MGGAYSMHGQKKNAYKSLVGEPENKRPLERHGQEYNIKMHIK
jgi:hypothetical protein